MAINYPELREKIQKMTRDTLIYKLLKEELSVLGYWKNKSRGDPRKGYEVSKDKRL
jgi:hypothetical protein